MRNETLHEFDVPPRIGVIILNWNGYRDTIACIESLMKSGCSDLEIVIVDNGSEGEDVEMLRKRFDTRVTLIETGKNYGFAVGNNIGIKHCLDSGLDYIVLLNNDTIVEPSTLSELVAAAQSIEGSGIVTPMHYSYPSPSTIIYAGRELDSHTGLDHFRVSIESSDPRETEVISGACMALKRAVLEKIGLIPEDYFFYWEDVDYSVRATRAGFRNIVVPTARIYHKVSASTRNLSDFALYHSVRGGVIFWRRYAPIRWPYFACFVVARLATRLSSRMGYLHFVGLVIRGVWSGMMAHRRSESSPPRSARWLS